MYIAASYIITAVFIEFAHPKERQSMRWFACRRASFIIYIPRVAFDATDAVCDVRMPRANNHLRPNERNAAQQMIMILFASGVLNQKRAPSGHFFVRSHYLFGLFLQFVLN